MRISDWSSDVCSSVLAGFDRLIKEGVVPHCTTARFKIAPTQPDPRARGSGGCFGACAGKRQIAVPRMGTQHRGATQRNQKERAQDGLRSEEHTSELQSLMRNSYAVSCLTQKKYNK